MVLCVGKVCGNQAGRWRRATLEGRPEGAIRPGMALRGLAIVTPFDQRPEHAVASNVQRHRVVGHCSAWAGRNRSRPGQAVMASR